MCKNKYLNVGIKASKHYYKVQRSLLGYIRL